MKTISNIRHQMAGRTCWVMTRATAHGHRVARQFMYDESALEISINGRAHAAGALRIARAALRIDVVNAQPQAAMSVDEICDFFKVPRHLVSGAP